MDVERCALLTLDIIRSRPSKAVYRCAKALLLGKPAFTRCAKELAECIFEIDTKKVAGEACKRAFLCLVPVGGVVGSTALVAFIDHPAAGSICKSVANGAGLLVTGPCYGFDRVVAPIETIIFGCPVPIVTDNRLFLIE